MQRHLPLKTRALGADRLLATLGFFFVSALLSVGLAYGATPIPVPATNPATAATARMITRYYQQLERQYPKGSRVFGVDQYVILDGNDSLTAFIDTSFHRDRAGALYVTDIGSGYTWNFSRHATITRYNNNIEMILRPGATDPEVERLIKLGGARLIKVLGGSSQAQAATPDTTCPLVGGWSSDPLCGGRKQWTGGGPGRIDGPQPPDILTAISNDCSITGKSLVRADYTVPQTYNTPVQASLCGGPGAAVCVQVPKPQTLSAPGSVNHVSVTYAGGGSPDGTFIENFAFNGATVRGATLPDCYYAPGCSAQKHL